jgi:hypothetical protein
MSISTATIVRQAMAAIPQKVATVAHEKSGAAYRGLASAAQESQMVSGQGAAYPVSARVRLFVADLQQPLPKAGDKIGVTLHGRERVDRVITGMEFDSLNETALVTYGEQYG